MVKNHGEVRLKRACRFVKDLRLRGQDCYRSPMSILVIDDDRELAGLLTRVFAKTDLVVEFCHDGRQGLARARRGIDDLVVLDVMLPGGDGFEILREIRRESDVPVLMLTARGDDVDRIVGLESGADDYLAKPFHPRELIARIRAILRRRRPDTGGRAGLLLDVAGVRLDSGARSVAVDGRPIELTTMEFDLLHALMDSAGRVLSRDTLIARIDGRVVESFDRAIDVHISHLRHKLGDAQRIRTVRGIGYQFVSSKGDTR